MTGYRVLLVDDEAEFVDTLAERLDSRGLKIEVAYSGPEAIQKAEEKNFDAIVLDFAMPGLDGIETMKALRATNPDLQIIFLTGQATVQKSIEAMKMGATDLMEKPADIQQLLEKIEKASTKKALLVEKHVEEKLQEIMSKKGW